MIPDNVPKNYSHIVLVTGSRTWDDEAAMIAVFRRIWLDWGTETITRPLLISGANPRGADAMAERLWYDHGFEILSMPANWAADGRAAGPKRNQRMVNAAQVMRDAGALVACAAFLDLCTRPDCPKAHLQQLAPAWPGHFSHGTIHCRDRALVAGLLVHDVLAQPVAAG